MYYKLNGKVPEPCNLEDFARTFRTRWQLLTKVGEATVSTVFLGMDHNHSGKGEPVLFETMVFDHPEDIQHRYCTMDEAIAGHNQLAEELLNANK